VEVNPGGDPKIICAVLAALSEEKRYPA